MKLQAVFWDYPQFQDEKHLRQFLDANKHEQSYYWVMNRFLEHGRVVDTFKFFTLKEIAAGLNKLKLNPYSRQKWTRLLEVYDSSERR